MPATILVVEDTLSNRELLSFLLRYHGYEVLEAENGESGVSMARANKPDLIAMDMQMPVMDGMTAMRKLKKDPETSGIKIIAVTSFAMKGDREKALEAGFDGYITKPIDTRAFPDQIRSFLPA
ncbi:response regulator [Fundidesulfovibrio putealis]|uniref:response regulator n=1 Tax=Fundidesulfovibrio putealis TaxID=270496 RepID=UPI0004225D7D|nr:response regulator [Fundidesulfovibrio putealis]